MTAQEMLQLLKVDLQISSNAYDEYLQTLLEAAQAYITTERASLTSSVGDCMLIIQYAAYLYRFRRAELTAMPRPLRWALNNRIFSEKGKING